MSEISKILKSYNSVAVVGLSDNPDRPSYHVAEYLKQQGYRIIPVNPALQAWGGDKAYPDLLSIPEPLEIVNIFRKPADVPPIVDQAIQKGAKVIWMQEGIDHPEAAEKARKAGLQVIMNQCIAKEYAKLN